MDVLPLVNTSASQGNGPDHQAQVPQVEREREISGIPKMPKHQISQSVAGFCFYWSEKRSTGGLEQRGMPQSD